MCTHMHTPTLTPPHPLHTPVLVLQYIHSIYTAVFICRSASSITFVYNSSISCFAFFLAVYAPAGNYLISSKVPISIPKAVSLVGTYRYCNWEWEWAHTTHIGILYVRTCTKADEVCVSVLKLSVCIATSVSFGMYSTVHTCVSQSLRRMSALHLTEMYTFSR